MTASSSPVPQVSVLLPVYNCPDYVGAAIDSILGQTMADFELIIIDDGSSDSTPEVLKGYDDPRIRAYRQDNQGLAATLNKAIALAKAPLLARQDQDDLSHPERLARQLAYMQAHPTCGLLGTWAQIMERDTLVERFHRHPVDPGVLRYELLFNNPFVHSSVMLRKSVVEQLGGYSTDPERQPPEDYELWSRIARVSEVGNIPECLLTYREIPTSMSRTGVSPFQQRLVRICAENLALSSKRTSDDPAVHAIAAITHGSTSLISASPDFQAMRLILAQVIESCSTDEACRSGLRRDAEVRLANLKAAWFADRSPLAAALRKQGMLRRVAKRLLKAWTDLRGA